MLQLGAYISEHRTIDLQFFDVCIVKYSIFNYSQIIIVTQIPVVMIEHVWYVCTYSCICWLLPSNQFLG